MKPPRHSRGAQIKALSIRQRKDPASDRIEAQMMICPNHLTCTRNDDGVGDHCGRHPEAEGCWSGADDCPPCVPCTKAPAEKEAKKEAV